MLTTMRDILISIIVPVFNVEEYVARTLESICTQTYEDLEIIVVDDGSTDESGIICDSFAAQDSRIKVIHKKNGGLVSARKTGIKYAKGKYTVFVDGDDWIEKEMICELQNVIVRYDVEMVSSGITRDYQSNYAYYVDCVSEGYYDSERIRTLTSRLIFWEGELNYGIRPNLAGKMICTRLLKELYTEMPDKIENGEDSAIVYPALFKVHSFYTLHKCFYHYVMRMSSITHVKNNDYMLTMHYWYRFVLQHIDEKNNSVKKQIDALFVKLIIRGINYHMDIYPDVTIPSYVLPRSLPTNSRIVLYGAGKVGGAYYKQLKGSTEYKCVAWVDQKWNEEDRAERRVEYIEKCEFDYVLIAVTYQDLAEDIKKELHNRYGVPMEKIIWYEPKGILDSYGCFFNVE